MEQNDSVQSVEAFNDHAANVMGESIKDFEPQLDEKVL